MSNCKEKEVVVIGGGLAGSEAAYYLASHGIQTTLVEMKPIKFTPAHESENYGELVCSNSLKSNDVLPALPRGKCFARPNHIPLSA